jgi:hypothetical protein
VSYEKILEALNQELVCVDRAIGFLTKAGGHDLASLNGSLHNAQQQPESDDRTVELQMRSAAQNRAAKRQSILADLRDEQALLLNAIDSIHRLAERTGY